MQVRRRSQWYVDVSITLQPYSYFASIYGLCVGLHVEAVSALLEITSGSVNIAVHRR
jgi:hypothetical protein